MIVRSCVAIFAAVGSVYAYALASECIDGELPANAEAIDFVLPRIPLACWRAERKGEMRGVFFRVYYSVTPEGRTENIQVDDVDPPCAEEYVIVAVKEWRYSCSTKGREFMKTTIHMNTFGG